MKKQNKFSSLSVSELIEKQKFLMKELVSFKVSMDPSVITESGNREGLLKDVKFLRRQIAMASSQKTDAVGG